MTTAPDDPDTAYESAPDWAARVGVSARSARRYAEAGKVPARWDGRGWLIVAGTPAPDTAPTHMRPAPRVIPGEVVEHVPGQMVLPHTAAPPVAGPGRAGQVVTPDPPVTPLPPPTHLLMSPDEFRAVAGPHLTERGLFRMLKAGLIEGMETRGPGEGGWLIPRAEITRLWGPR